MSLPLDNNQWEIVCGHEVVETLHRGRTADALLAVPEQGGAPVVIKRLHAGMTSCEETRLSFIRDAYTATLIHHPNVSCVHEMHEETAGSHRLYLVMEYVEGVTLEEVLQSLEKRGKRLPPHFATGIVLQILSGLSAAPPSLSYFETQLTGRLAFVSRLRTGWN